MLKTASESESESYKSLSDLEVDSKEDVQEEVTKSIAEVSTAGVTAIATAISTATAAATATTVGEAIASATALETAIQSDATIDAANFRRTKYTRGEKKARRMLIKQGSRPLPNISRLVMRQAQMLFIIDNAEVYKNPKSDTYIIFGEVKIEDLTKYKQNISATNHIMAAQTIAKSSNLYPIKPVVPEEPDIDEIVDETGIDPKDIELVMSQTSTTRAKAVRALKENDNDIVNAIMNLTM